MTIKSPKTRKIEVDTKVRTSLIRDFKVSCVTVRSALRYRTHSALSETLRVAAIERGGKILEEVES